MAFRVEIDEKLAASAVTLHDAALAAVKALDDAVVHRMKMFRAVHAGALLIDGKALLLPGTSHAGKSSLVAELLRRGASHYSDEYALIDDQGLTHSYPRPLLLRNGSPMQTLVLPEELNAHFANQPAPAGWILALDYVPGGHLGRSTSCRRGRSGHAAACATPPTKWRNLPRWSTSFFALQKRPSALKEKRGEAS